MSASGFQILIFGFLLKVCFGFRASDFGVDRRVLAHVKTVQSDSSTAYGTNIASITPAPSFGNIPSSTLSLRYLFSTSKFILSGQAKSGGSKKTRARDHPSSNSSGFSRPKKSLACLRKCSSSFCTPLIISCQAARTLPINGWFLDVQDSKAPIQPRVLTLVFNNRFISSLGVSSTRYRPVANNLDTCASQL